MLFVQTHHVVSSYQYYYKHESFSFQNYFRLVYKKLKLLYFFAECSEISSHFSLCMCFLTVCKCMFVHYSFLYNFIYTAILFYFRRMGTEDFVFAENAKMCFFLVYGNW